MGKSSEDRFRHLMGSYEKLKFDTGRHFENGCRETPYRIDELKERIFASVYGIRTREPSVEMARFSLRWLLSHSYRSKVTYSPDFDKPQWSTIMEHYFRKWEGHYAEVAVLERLLLTFLRKPSSPTGFTDIYLADRMGDYEMMTDWIMSQNLLHGTIRTGIQVAAGSGGRGKLFHLSKRHLSDSKVMTKHGTGIPPMIQEFMRDGTGIFSFPHFSPSQSTRTEALRKLLAGSTRYQSQLLAHNGSSTRFIKIGRQVADVLRFFHQGIIDRLIDPRGHLVHHRFDAHNHPLETIYGNIFDFHGMPILGLRLEEGPFHLPKVRSADRPRIKTITPFTFYMPLVGDYLDRYRDLAGVRAQS